MLRHPSPALALVLALPACRPDAAAPPGREDTALPAAPVSAVEVAVHPGVATILEVRWTQDEAADLAWIAYGLPGEEPLATPALPAAVGERHQLLLGLPGEAEVWLQVQNEIGGDILGGEPVQALTGAVPELLPRPALSHWDPALASGERWLIGSIGLDDRDWYEGPWWLYAIDRRARIVWYREVSEGRCTMHAALARDGTHLLFEETTIYQGDRGARSRMRRLGLDLVRDEAFDVPYLGSTFAEVDDGAILFDSYADAPAIALDERGPDGSLRRIWTCDDWLPEALGGRFACDPNETVWVPERDSVLWSMWDSDTVVELDRQSGAVLRQLGALEGSWAFDPPGAGFDMQHYPHFTAAGTLLVSTHVPGEPGQQRAREYALDEPSRTLREIWSYGQEVPHYAVYAGEALRLANGNTLISYGSDGSLREVSPALRTAWQVDWPSSFLLGHVTLVDDLYALVEQGS